MQPYYVSLEHILEVKKMSHKYCAILCSVVVSIFNYGMFLLAEF